MTLSFLLPVAVMLVGLGMLVLSRSWGEIARICFFCGLLVTLFLLASGHLRLTLS